MNLLSWETSDEFGFSLGVWAVFWDKKIACGKPCSRTEQVPGGTWRQESGERSRKDSSLAGGIRRAKSVQGHVGQGRDFSLLPWVMGSHWWILSRAQDGQIYFHFYSKSLFIHSSNKYLLSKHTKRCSPSLVIRKLQVKPQWDTITHKPEWLKGIAKSCHSCYSATEPVERVIG